MNNKIEAEAQQRAEEDAELWEAIETAGSVQDVQINGTSILDDGVANIPLANSTTKGVVSSYNNKYTGIEIIDGIAYVNSHTDADVDDRGSALRHQPLCLDRVDYAVKCALTDGKGAAYSEAEKKAGRERIGALNIANMPIVAELDIAPKTATTRINLLKPCLIVMTEVVFDSNNANNLSLYSGMCYQNDINNLYRSTGIAVQNTSRKYWSIMFPSEKNNLTIFQATSYGNVHFGEMQTDFPEVIKTINNVMIHAYDANNFTANAHIIVRGV